MSQVWTNLLRKQTTRKELEEGYSEGSGRQIAKQQRYLKVLLASEMVHDVSVPTLDTPQSGLHDTRHFTLGNTMFD